MSSFLLSRTFATARVRAKARSSAIRISSSSSSSNNNNSKNDHQIRRRLLFPQGFHLSSSRSFNCDSSSSSSSSPSCLFFHRQDQFLLNSHSNNNNDFQTRSMSSVWGYFFPSSKDENDQIETTPEIAMPPRQNQTSSSSSTTTTSTTGRTKFDKEEMEAQQIIGQRIGTLAETTWSKVEDLIQRLLSNNNISIAFWLLDRLSKEPNSSTNLSVENMIEPVIKHWCSAYVSQQRKRKSKGWEQGFGRHVPSSTGNNKNRLYPPRTVWKKLDSYQSRGGIQLTNSIYNRLIDATAYANVRNLDSPNGPVLADKILQKMIDLSSMNKDQSTIAATTSKTKIKPSSSDIQPTRRTFNAAIASWESAATNCGPRSDAYDRATKRSLELLNQLKSLYRDGYDHECMPNRATYMQVMRLFAHQGNGDMVEQLMEEMYSMYLDHNKHQAFLPSIDFFSLVLFAWSRSKDPDAAERALEIFERILELEAEQEIPGLEVTARTYNIVLLTIGFVATEEAANTMQSLFDRMVELSKTDPNKRPTASTYAALTTGWSKIDPSRAEQVLSTWKKEAEAGNCTMAIDAKMIGILIGGWYDSNAPNCPEMCERLLQDAIEQGTDVNASSFDMTINAWCRKKTKDAAYRSESLLRQMQEYEDEQKTDLKPTIYTYAPIIFCYAKLKEAARAEALLREFFERYPEKERGITKSTRKTRLDTRIINGVLESWLSRATKDSLAVERSERLLLDMLPTMQVHPNIESFELVLKCKQSQKNSPLGSQIKSNARREEVIALLDDEYKNGNLRCNLEEYLTKRQAWIMFNA